MNALGLSNIIMCPASGIVSTRTPAASRPDSSSSGSPRSPLMNVRGIAIETNISRIVGLVPIVRPILLVGLLYSVVFSFTDFSAVWLLTQGGPYNTTHVFGTYAYNIGINAGDIGMGAAITLFIFPFLALIVVVMLRFLRRE